MGPSRCAEHISFDLSYLTAALIAALTVSLYISSVTKRFALGCIISGMFTVLYTYLFFSLKSEDYALLLGAFFSFGILALIMFITRKVDWYNLKKKENNYIRLFKIVIHILLNINKQLV